MNRIRRSRCRSAFTFVELLLALAIGALVAAVLAALVHGLFSAGEGQTQRLRGPFAARAALRLLSREASCAFAPPVENLPPLLLSTSSEIGKPETVLSFYVPVQAPLGYDIEHVTYEVAPIRGELRELRRISVPCSGPLTNAPVTNFLYEGRFALAVEAVTNGTSCAEWPPPESTDKPSLPSSLRLTLSLPDHPSLQTEVLLQAALGIPSPVERKKKTDAESAEQVPPGGPSEK